MTTSTDAGTTTIKTLYLSKKALKARGWTDALIEDLLGAPDRTPVNMHYKSGPRVSLYTQVRVVNAEATDKFQAIQKDRAPRRAAATKAVETKRQQTEDYVSGVKIEVPVFPDEELLRRAVNHYNALHGGRSDFEMAAESSDRGFLDRICVNYVRHCCTGYEHHLARTAGAVGSAGAYVDIKMAVLDAIADAYPDLGAECSRQASAIEAIEAT